MSVATCERVDAKGRVCGGEIEDGVCGTCGRPVQKGALLAASSGAPTPIATATQSRGGTGTIGQGRTGSGRISRRQSSGGTTSRRQSLGGGLVSLPPVPSQDPEKLVIANPEVAPNKRHCPHCRTRVNRMNGFCPQCSKPYDFRPSLKKGDIVGGKYEIRGPIGLGGMGWIYLASDVVLKRWVVLKGVLNAEDPEAAAAAVAERQFLAAVKDARIVAIYDFIAHGAQGYMVLEYVGGRTVDDIRGDNDIVDLLDPDGKIVKSGLLRKDLTPADKALTAQVTRFGVLPPEQAISYILAILPAFSYLHGQGFTHNDMKPDNVMVEGDSVKLLDLGAMRKIGDEGGPIFGTDGFFAPEAEDGPVAVSDLYAVGRTLAVILMDFLYKVRADRDATTNRVTTRRLIVTGYKSVIPLPDEQPVLEHTDSLYRFLLRATHEDPDQRFQSAEEMEGQLFGILREIMAEKTGPKPAESRVFFGDGLVDGADRAGTMAPLARLLPGLRIDAGDPAAAELLGLSAIVDPAKRVEALTALAAKRTASVEAKLRLADAMIAQGLAMGLPDGESVQGNALAIAERVLKENEFDWRGHWYAGKALLAMGRAKEAFARFDRVYFEMPGELAPRLAMAFASEASGDTRRATILYGRVAMIDPACACASFGLARCLAGSGSLGTRKAAEALAAIPPSHSMVTASRIALARVLIAGDHEKNPDFLGRAAETIAAITTRDGSVHRLSAQLYTTAVDLLDAGARPQDEARDLLGKPMKARAMRLAAEEAFLQSARTAGSASEKALWVDMAHRLRPRTLV